MDHLKVKRLIISLAPLLFFLPFTTSAQEYPDKYGFNIGSNYVWDSNSEISANSSSGLLGTAINFHRDLDGDEQSSNFWLGGFYRFTPHHKIDISWFRINRKGDKVLSRTISFGNREFTLDANVNSEIDAQFLEMAYTWSFYHSETVEIGLRGGFMWLDYNMNLRGPLNRKTEQSFRDPVPTLGILLDYTINPRWHIKYLSDAIYFNVNDKFRGSLDNTKISLEWRATPNYLVGLGAARTSVDAEINGDYRGKVVDFYRSIRVYFGARF
jgi:hypothetical protein